MSPSKVDAAMNQVSGFGKVLVGTVIGNDDLRKEGEKERESADDEWKAKQGEQKAESAVDGIKSGIKSVAADITGSDDLKAESKEDQAKSDAKDTASRF